MPTCIIQQAQLPERLQAGRLQQETRAHRARFGHALEDLDVVVGMRQRQCACLSRRAVADDGDVPTHALVEHRLQDARDLVHRCLHVGQHLVHRDDLVRVGTRACGPVGDDAEAIVIQPQLCLLYTSRCV